MLADAVPSPPASLQEDAVRRIAEARPRGLRRLLSRWAPVGASVVAVVAGLCVLFAPRGGDVSADQVLEKMEAALGGRCMSVTWEDGSTGEPTGALWFEVAHGDNGCAYRVRIECAPAQVVEAWSDGVRRHYDGRSGTLVLSHHGYEEWLRRAPAMVRVARLLDRDTENPRCRPRVIGADELQGHRCYLVAWGIILTAGPDGDGLATPQRDVWWVDRQTHLPVAACRYHPANPGAMRPEDVPADPEEARQAIRSPQNEILRFRLVEAPPGFFQLRDLSPQLTRDVRPEQDALLARSGPRVEDRQVSLTVHDVLSAEGGAVYACVSFRPTQAGTHLAIWPQCPYRSVPWSVVQRRWDHPSARAGASSGIMSTPSSITTRHGLEYLTRWREMFALGDSMVYLLRLTPVRPVTIPHGGEVLSMALRLALSDPTQDLLAPPVTPSPTLSLDLRLPYPTLRRYALPSWLSTFTECTAAGRALELRYEGDLVRESADILRWQGRPDEALHLLDEANRWFEQADQAGGSDPGRRVPASDYMSVYADLGNVGEARRYAELARQEALSRPMLVRHADAARKAELAEIERCLRYVDSLE
jgi:hypothetical protein